MQGRESGEDKQREESEGLEAEKNGASGVGLHSPTFFLFSFSSFDFLSFFFPMILASLWTRSRDLSRDHLLFVLPLSV